MTTVISTPAVGRGVAAAVARFALHECAAADDEERPHRPLEPRPWSDLLATCRTERTIGLLSAALSTGWLRATDEQAEAVDGIHLSLMGGVVMLEQLLVFASSHLSAASVGHRVLKGSAHAWLDWPEPSLRTFHDVDILLANDYDTGLRTLELAGCRRRTIEVHRGFDRRFGKGTTMVGPTTHEVDVHRTLAAGAYGLLIKRNELLESGDQLVVGGCPLLALARPQRLVHACYHAALGDVRARHATLRDVGELILGCDPDERRRALELAGSWDGRAPVAIAISAATALLRLPSAHPLVQWALAYEPTGSEERRLQAYSGEGRSFAAQAIEGFRVLPTIGDRLAYATHLLFADPQHLRARGESPGHRWARAVQLACRRAQQ